MKTFEERYTAWIDGQLEGTSLTAFEQELERRAAGGEARAERTETQRLRDLLRNHLEAPVLNNAEFFSHQLRERINAERTTGTRRAPSPAAKGGFFASLFPWSVARLAWTGAACLFVAGALYYGLEPGPGSNGPAQVALNKPAKTQAVQPEQVVADNSAAPSPERKSVNDGNFVKASPTPAPFDDSPDIKVNPSTPASGTPLLYSKPNVNVLWTNGLDYLPEVPTPAAPSTSAPDPAPSASAAP